MLERLWYSQNKLCWLLWPLHLLVRLVSAQRLTKLRKGAQHCPIPVIVVGNVTVGGTGKTPIVIELVRHFQQKGLRVAVVSRGYGGHSERYPLNVTEVTSAGECGDEPLMIQQITGAQVVVDPVRNRAYQQLVQSEACDLVISDDGLQHFGLPRTVEIAVVDKERGLGNGLCLPVGPLRESGSRLNAVDFVLGTGRGDFTKVDFSATNIIETAVRFDANESKPLADFVGQRVTAIAGIGNPQKFFDSLKQIGLLVDTRPMPDHHAYQLADLTSDWPVMMTEKDAVKCKGLLANDPVLAAQVWVVPLQTRLPDEFFARLHGLLYN